jgi:hypothetical protein
MKKASKIIIPLAAVLLLVALVLPVTSIHVAKAYIPPADVWVAPPPLGIDASDRGTEAAPFATIGYGILNVASDGTVHVAAGTYHENLHISGAQNLDGAGAPVTIIDGGDSGRVLDISSAISSNTISGFTIQGGNLPIGPGSYGGGIYIFNTHSVTIDDCTIKDNQSQLGGGISNWGQLHMNRCTVSGNSATDLGGGIHNKGEMWLTNCTISGNHMTHDEAGGGGIWNDNNMTLVNCTIAYNSAGTTLSSAGGGFMTISSGTVSFKNTLVANNTAGNSRYNNGYIEYPPITSLGYNLSGDDSCGFDQPTDLVNTDPLLGPLQDNGGPTFTQALLHGSPAIDKGGDPIAVVTDQRGVPRPQGPAFDIGAYELAQASVGTSTHQGTAYFSTLDGYITDLEALNESQTDCGALPNSDFPFGIFSFNVTDITPGSTVTIVIILPSNASIDTQYWKCLNGHWVDCTSLLGSNDGDQVLTLSITDGGLGDGDGLANGQISDPGGPITTIATPTHPSVSPSLPRLLNPPQMSVQYLSVSPKQATASQPVTISTNVVNTGDQGGNLNIALKINGQVEQTKMVAVGPQTSQPIKFTVTKSEPGTYSVDIGGQTGSFIIPDTSSKSTPVNSGMIIFLVLGALILATVLVLIFSRKSA